MNWLITGVSSGLGRALAQAALARGDQVAGTVRSEAAAAAFEALAPGKAHALTLDLRDLDAVPTVVAAAERALGRIDILVNNAGYGLVGAVEEASLQEVRDQFAVNVFAPFAMMKAVLPAMRARRSGRIVNITSVSGLAVWAGTGVYCGSKFALEGIGQTLAQEVAELGIKVIHVAPGGLRTDYSGRSLVLSAENVADYDGAARDAKRILADHAGHEPGDPAKAARAILAVTDLDEPPMHLLLGADAMLYATRHMSGLLAEIGANAALSLSTGFDEQP
jgi:NAD(P)-dependent dehydrogenase (short-subunit alcohol dehydrogenase family)